MKRTIAMVIAATALATGLAACGDDDDDGLSAEQQYCSDLAQLDSDVNALLSVDVTSVSLDDLEAARDQISDDLTAVSESAEAVGEQQVSDVEDAYSDLEEGIDDLSGDETLSEAYQELTPQIQAVLTSIDNLDTVDCSTVEVETDEE